MPRRLRRTVAAITMCLIATAATGCSVLDRGPHTPTSDERLAQLMSELVNPLRPGVSMGLASLPSTTNQAYALLGLSISGMDVPEDLRSRTLADLGRSYSPETGLFAMGRDPDDHVELTSLVLALAHEMPDAAPALLPQERIPVLRRALQQAATTTDANTVRTAAADASVLLDAVVAGPASSAQRVCGRLDADAQAGAASPALLGVTMRAGCRHATSVAASQASDAWPTAGSVFGSNDWPEFDRLLLSLYGTQPCPSCQTATTVVNSETQRTGERAAPLVPVVETGSLYRTVLLAQATGARPQDWVQQALMRQLQWRGRIIEDVQTDPVLLTWALRTMQAGSAAVPAGVLDRLQPAVRHEGGADGPYGPIVRAIAAGAAREEVARLVTGAAAEQPRDARALSRLAAGVIYSESCTPPVSNSLLGAARSAGLAVPPHASADPVSRYYAALAWRALGICKTTVPDSKSGGADHAGAVRAAMVKAVSAPGDWQPWPELWLDSEIECAMSGRSSLDRAKVTAAVDTATRGDMRARYDVAEAYALARVSQIARSGCGHAWWEPR